MGQRAESGKGDRGDQTKMASTEDIGVLDSRSAVS